MDEHTKVCKTCGLDKPITEYTKYTGYESYKPHCKKCVAAKYRGARKEYWKKYYQKHKDHYREKRPRAAQSVKHSYQRLRLHIIKEYGGKCICCGCSVPQFLAIDHINNDGAKHREAIGGGKAILYFLKKHNYPKDNFQLLCHNCNSAKQLYKLSIEQIQELIAKNGIKVVLN